MIAWYFLKTCTLLFSNKIGTVNIQNGQTHRLTFKTGDQFTMKESVRPMRTQLAPPSLLSVSWVQNPLGGCVVTYQSKNKSKKNRNC